MKYCVRDYDNKPVPILEMWESFNGAYWFITEVDKSDPDYCYGLVDMENIGMVKEWGTMLRSELKNMGPYKVWKVKKNNWGGAKGVEVFN